MLESSDVPSELAALYHAGVEAVRLEQWMRLAELCDPPSLELFRRRLLSSYSEEWPDDQISVETLLHLSPEISRAEAERQLSELKRRADPRARLAEDLPNVESLEQLQSMSAAETFALWLEAHSMRFQFTRGVQQGTMSGERAERALSRPQAATPTVILGAVRDGGRLCHLIFRADFTGLAVDAIRLDQWETQEQLAFLQDTVGRNHLEFLTCRRSADGIWRLLAEPGMFGMGTALFYPMDDDPTV